MHGNEGKGSIPITNLAAGIKELLDKIQHDLYHRANDEFKSHVKKITVWDEFVPSLNSKNINLIPHCLKEECEDKVKELSARKEEGDDAPQDEKAPSMGAKSLCIPFEQPNEGLAEDTGCLRPGCNDRAQAWCLFGRSY